MSEREAKDRIKALKEGADKLGYVVFRTASDLDGYEQTRGPLKFLEDVGGLLHYLGERTNEGKIEADEWGGYLQGIGFMVEEVVCRLAKLADHWSDRVYEEIKSFRQSIEGVEDQAAVKEARCSVS